MTVRILALTSVNEAEVEALSTYLATTGPLLEDAGATILERFNVVATIVGEEMPITVTIVGYPDVEATDKVFKSAEYGLLQEVRARAFRHYQVGLLDG
jgi:uncharacterized protein (DUF1330 family)